MTEAFYGKPPRDLGLVNISPIEMMFWLYCPIKLPRSNECTVPDNLLGFMPLVEAVRRDLPPEVWRANYIYLTAKTLWVTHENPGNRRGWHSDGFMTDDLNYVWSDRDGTLFWTPLDLITFTQDHSLSLAEMDEAAELGPHKTYPDKHLLKLDQSVIHRVADFAAAGVRSFAKISVSRHRYNLAGNSINHALAADWELIERKPERNHPIGHSHTSADALKGELYPCKPDIFAATYDAA